MSSRQAKMASTQRLFWYLAKEITIAKAIKLATKAKSRKNDCREAFQLVPIQRKQARRNRQGLLFCRLGGKSRPSLAANSPDYFSLLRASTRSSGVRFGANFSAVPPAAEIFSSADLLKR